ncbi:MAG: MerR family transcriptional regulator [Betaproteobacteria bacterium]
MSWTLEALASLVDLPKRTVRYYIQLGLVDRPDGETRAARYGMRHAAQLQLIRKWTDAGLSLERIRELLAGEVPEVPHRASAPGTVEVKSHVTIAEGIELSLDPTRAGLSPEETRALFNGVIALYANIKNKGAQS